MEDIKKIDKERVKWVRVTNQIEETLWPLSNFFRDIKTQLVEEEAVVLRNAMVESLVTELKRIKDGSDECDIVPDVIYLVGGMIADSKFKEGLGLDW